MEMDTSPPITTYTPTSPPEPEGLRNILPTLLILMAAPLIALTLTTFVFQSYEVEGPSMETTLDHHDRLIVVKTARTWSRFTGKPYIPARGDIIIFARQAGIESSTSREKQLIKRVIALPGERVLIKDGVVTVYNKANPAGFSPDKTLPYGDVIGTTPINIDTTVPAESVFVLGDNRTNSLDSRTFGPIKASDIVGKLSLRILPLSKIDKF